MADGAPITAIRLVGDCSSITVELAIWDKLALGNASATWIARTMDY